MVVVAGPSGSGKSVCFRISDFGVDFFNVDERCRELHGSFQGIPPEIRLHAQKECELFVEGHIRTGVSFATETTLRTTIAIEQAKQARSAGFVTSVIYVATNDAAINVERVRRRGLAGGIAATPETVRENYRLSMGNLPNALAAFNRSEVFDNSDLEPRLVLEVKDGQRRAVHEPVPAWLRNAIPGISLDAGFGESR